VFFHRGSVEHKGSANGIMASKSSAESNEETGTKRHLWPLDAFSGLLVRRKCICGPWNPTGEGYSAPPNPLAGGEGTRCLLPKNPGFP